MLTLAHPWLLLLLPLPLLMRLIPAHREQRTSVPCWLRPVDGKRAGIPAGCSPP